MKTNALFLCLVIFIVFWNITWGEEFCPKDPHDRGICDSMYVEPWSADTLLQGNGPYFVRVPIYVTTDVVNYLDSIAGFTIPLCYTHSNPTEYCSLSNYWNKTILSGGTLPRSIFRHLVMGSDTTHNWMLRLKEMGDDVGENWEWANIILNLDGTSHFWLGLVPTTQPNMGKESKALLATMTFKMSDTMQICIDTCFWPPQNNLMWVTYDDTLFSLLKIPRLGTPHEDTADYKVCFNFHKPADVKEILNSDNGKPSQFSLSQNYPNPFNPVTNFQLTLPKSTHVKIDVLNIVGQKVKTLLDQDMKPGVYIVDWDGKDESGNSVSSGVYFYKIKAGDFSDTKRMVLLK